MPVPDEASLLRLVWSTMAAVDHANKTANYSVLRELGSAGFKASNSPAALASAFAPIRARRVDLADILLVAPTWEFTPALVGPRILRLRGSFRVRPTAILFDLLYEWDQGWRLEAVAVLPQPTPTELPRR
jgi:hypothetical protein